MTIKKICSTLLSATMLASVVLPISMQTTNVHAEDAIDTTTISTFSTPQTMDDYMYKMPITLTATASLGFFNYSIDSEAVFCCNIEDNGALTFGLYSLDELDIPGYMDITVSVKSQEFDITYDAPAWCAYPQQFITNDSTRILKDNRDSIPEYNAETGLSNVPFSSICNANVFVDEDGFSLFIGKELGKWTMTPKTNVEVDSRDRMYYIDEDGYKRYFYEPLSVKINDEVITKNIGTEPKPLSGIQGDVNNDDQFSVADLVVFQRWLLNDKNYVLDQWQAADYNHDEILNVFDLVMMKKAILDVEH